MSQDDKYNKNSGLMRGDEETGDDDQGGKGGKSGQVEFRDFLTNRERLRDDVLPGDEKRRLLSVHKDTHAIKVKEQKERREAYAKLKSGKMALQTYRQALTGSGINSQFKANPAIADKAQFSGIDRQVIGDPVLNEAKTNEQDRNELQNELQLRLGLQPSPKFNPKPSPYNR